MTNITLGIFKKVFAPLAPYKLFFSPVYNPNNGWGAPFDDDAVPPVDINPPFGTALGTTSTHDDRHKISDVIDGAVTNNFGEQWNDFPGNNHWTDGTKFLNWWGAPTWGYEDQTVTYIKNNNLGTEVGDCGGYGPTQETYGIYIASSRLSSTTFNFIKISSINDKFYVNDTPYTLTTFHSGHGGRHISGCGMIGDWIIYIDIFAVDTFPDGINTEYVNAYNINTLTYRELGTFQSETTGQYFMNMMDIAFSQNGLNFISQRSINLTSGTKYNKILRGVISLDGSGDPVSVSTALDAVNYTRNVFYYGYKNNVEDVKYWISGGDYNTYLCNWDVNTGFALGTVHADEYYPDPNDTNDPIYPIPKYLFVMVNEKIFLYNVDTDTGLADYATPALTFDDWDDYVATFSAATIDIDQRLLEFHSIAIKDAGAFFSIRRDLVYTYAWPRTLNNERLNVWIKLDGTGVDLGETLLNNTVNGADLSCNPLTVSKI